MVDISILIWFINQLITGGAPACKHPPQTKPAVTLWYSDGLWFDTEVDFFRNFGMALLSKDDLSWLVVWNMVFDLSMYWE